MYVEWGTIMQMLPLFSNNIGFSTIPQFPFRGGWGGLTENDHEFPFLRIIEFFERSLRYVRGLEPVHEIVEFLICSF